MSATKPTRRSEKALAAACEALAWEIAGIMPSKLADASLEELAVALGKVIDTMQLVRGKPTRIVRVVGGRAKTRPKRS